MIAFPEGYRGSSAPPPRNDDTPRTVHLEIDVNSYSGVDVKALTLTIDFVLCMEWYDSRYKNTMMRRFGAHEVLAYLQVALSQPQEPDCPEQVLLHRPGEVVVPRGSVPKYRRE